MLLLVAPGPDLMFNPSCLLTTVGARAGRAAEREINHGANFTSGRDALRA